MLSTTSKATLLVRAVTVMSKSEIAVDAEHTVAEGIPVLLEYLIEILTCSIWCAQFSAMLAPFSVNMVNRQKLNVGLTTAHTNRPPIGLKHFKFQSLSVLSLSLSLLFRVFPGHKKSASHQRAALIRHADERQLEVSIA